MSNTLLAAVRLYADAHADHTGVAQTPVPGLTLIRATSKTALRYDVQRPLVCLVVQGSKHVSIGRQSFTFHAGDSLLIMADVPTASQITRADASAPYYSLVLDLDPAVITDLTTEIAATGQTDHAALRCAQTDDEVANAALQLLRLLARPEAIPLLQAQRLRDFHYWLLAGRHGPALRRIGLPNSHLQRIARAVAVLKAGYRQRLPVEHLASAAGMSVSSFHQNFRAVTSLTPLQFQKQLRLIEARRMMFAEGANASHAAFAVGYESVHQFSREYGRMFGLPPARDRDQHSDRLQAIA